MYERGVADAYRGTPNPFYYQNFEPYRKAYERTRQRIQKTSSMSIIDIRRIVLNALFVVAVAGILLAVWHFTTTEVIVRSDTVRTPIILPTLAPSQVLKIASPTPLPSTLNPLMLKKGGKAIIQNTEQNPLRVRVSPSTDAQIVAYMRDDEQVEVVEGPILADGFVWWQIKGSAGIGWSAESNNEGITWIIPVP